MKQFQNLTIHSDLSEEETISRIAAKLPKSWTRDQKLEVDLMVNVDGKLYCFELKSTKAGAARLWANGGKHGVTVANIVPLDKNQLTPDEYNEILRLFVHDGVDGQFRYDLTKAEITLDDVLGEDSATRFKKFSGAANKSTGHSHPLDDQRWLEFIYSTVRNGEKLDFKDLVFFLIDDGWDQESANELAGDFSYGSRAMKYALEAERTA
jgi:hypothetical protein